MKRKTNTDPVLQQEISGTTQSVRTIIMSTVTKKSWALCWKPGISFLELKSGVRCQILKRYWVGGGIKSRSIWPANPYIKAMSAVFEGYSSNLTNYCSTPYPAGEKFSLEFEFQYFAKGKLAKFKSCK